MASVMAIVSKAVFEKDARGAAPGHVYATALYRSHHAALGALAAGDALFLVTVRPPDERLWLVAVLEGPTHGSEGYAAAPNATPIRDITALVGALRFASGAGLHARPGALGMSLQTPRTLAVEDVALLRGGAPPATAAASASVPAGAPTPKPAAKSAPAQAAKPAPKSAPAEAAKPAPKPASAPSAENAPAAPAAPAKLGRVKPTTLVLEALGTLEHAALTTWPPPVWTADGTIALALARDRVTVRRTEPELPEVGSFTLPDGLRFVTARQDNYDSPWERSGVLSAALRPDGQALALVGDSAATLVGLDGAVTARWETEDAVVHSAMFGPGGRTLWLVLAGDACEVVALDGASLALRGRGALSGDFPDPAWLVTHPHPDEDVAVISISCGQDGFWVKVLELEGARVRVRKQRLSSKGAFAPVFGFGAGMVATGLEKKLLLRAWPGFEPRKGKVLGGNACGGVVCGERALVAVAAQGYKPSGIQAFRLPDGERLASGAWPQGEALLDTVSHALVTRRKHHVTVWRAEL